MTFLRTVSTRRLLALVAGLIVAAAGGTAIAVAATGNGPVPRPKPLARALHDALRAKGPAGITADITFTNNLISSTDFPGGPKDPLLQGASGRMWLSAGHLRLELQTSDGDGQVVVNGRSFWIYDPAANVVYRGTLPKDTGTAHRSSRARAIPSVAQITTELKRLAAHLMISGARPTDVAGQPAYRVRVSPRHDGGLFGDAQLAWDALRGIPLDFALYASGNSTPVLELKADGISFGRVARSTFAIAPPSSAKVIKVDSGAFGAAHGRSTARGKALARRLRGAKARSRVHGVAAVARHLHFRLAAKPKLAGLPRRSVSLLSWGGSPAALVTYGKGLGGIAVIERRAAAGKRAGAGGAAGTNGGLALPTVTINGITGHELDTPLGTVVTFTRGGVTYIVAGSVPAVAADAAAREI